MNLIGSNVVMSARHGEAHVGRVESGFPGGSGPVIRRGDGMFGIELIDRRQPQDRGKLAQVALGDVRVAAAAECCGRRCQAVDARAWRRYCRGRTGVPRWSAGVFFKSSPLRESATW